MLFPLSFHLFSEFQYSAYTLVDALLADSTIVHRSHHSIEGLCEVARAKHDVHTSLYATYSGFGTGVLLSDPTAEDFNNRLIVALKKLPSQPAPYLVHCLEGKDRTGYACALLGGLCGATYEELVADYLITYDNYYGITPETDRVLCNALLSLRLNPCLMYYAGVTDEAQLPYVDYAKAFSNYLPSHGMNNQQLEALILALTKQKNN